MPERILRLFDQKKRQFFLSVDFFNNNLLLFDWEMLVMIINDNFVVDCLNLKLVGWRIQLELKTRQLSLQNQNDSLLLIQSIFQIDWIWFEEF